MPDIKYGSNENAEKYSGAPGYFDQRARRRARDAPPGWPPRMDEEGIGPARLLVRHLVLPENISRADAVFEFLALEISPETTSASWTSISPPTGPPECPR